MGNFLGTTYVRDWQHSCASQFNCSSIGLVGSYGNPIFPLICPTNGTIPSDVWGITARACEESCGGDVMRQAVDFTSSAIAMTTWLLPWLSLIAQLPFQAKGWMNILSGCLAVGSPALATYSLALTAFNRWYTFRKFKKIKEKVQNVAHPDYRYMVERIDAAAFILAETQQCPMRANQRAGEFASLLVIDEVHQSHFWKIARKDLKNTRRGFTYSFLAQVLVAALAYLISFVEAVQDDVSLQFAASMVWSWLFPVVYGYIQIGSQHRAGCIKDALTENKIIPVLYDCDRLHYVHQTGLCPNADLHSPLEIPVLYTDIGLGKSRTTSCTVQSYSSRSATLVDPPDTGTLPHDSDEIGMTPLRPARHLDDALSPPTWLGFDIRGDERREGPIFNYARIFTWSSFHKHLYLGFETAVNNFRKGASIPATSDEAALICGFKPQQDLTAFATWGDISSNTFHHIIGATIIALFLQWGTTGAAIFVAYWTPLVGLGCNSGSYLIYGVAATVSWLMLVFSSLLSHAYMQRLEKNPHKRVSVLLGALAVLSRLVGKAIAICNAIWLVAFNVMDEIGVFENCWCKTIPSYSQDGGWALVFKSGQEIRPVAHNIWVGGFIWSISVCTITMLFFAYRQSRR